MLCRESNKLPVIYNVPNGQLMGSSTNGRAEKVQFSSEGYSTPSAGTSNICFAGKNDELVVAASANHNLYVWSLHNDQEMAGDQVVDQSAVVLKGHKSKIFSVRYNHNIDTLASAGKEKIIKLWTPIVQQ